jgi:hypothetical protein
MAQSNRKLARSPSGAVVLASRPDVVVQEVGMQARVIGILGASLLAGCGGGGERCTAPAECPAGDGGIVGTAAATLTANGAPKTFSVGVANLAVDLTLENRGTTALPLAFSRFAVSTPDGVQYQGDPSTASYAGGCDPSGSLTAGHSVECTVLFNLLTIQAPNIVSYMLTDGTLVSAPLSPITETVPSVMRTSCNAVCGSMYCYSAHALYLGGNCLFPSEAPLDSCATVPPDTLSLSGCGTVVFFRLECDCVLP